MPPIPNQPGATYSYSQFAGKDKFSLYLDIEGEILPLVAFSSNFALNEIPQASCTVGVGRDTSSPLAGQITSIAEEVGLDPSVPTIESWARA